jgi:hypothetical protein
MWIWVGSLPGAIALVIVSYVIACLIIDLGSPDVR